MSEPISTVQEYFDRLAAAFAGTDPAVAQDATYDAQEFLAGERETLAAAGAGLDTESQLVERLRRRFGEPEEVVVGYTATEVQVAAALAQPRPRRPASVGGRILGVLAEPRSYGALFFMLLSMPLGLLYFSWAVIGLSLSAGLGILVFGFLFFLFFMSTVRAVALVECRIVEALLGERMPRRPPVVVPKGRWIDKVRFWVTDGRTWLTILYMIVRLPLGIVYFVVTAVFLIFALFFLLAPIVQLFLPFPIIHVMGSDYFLPLWFLPLLWLGGVVDLLALMHISRFVGHWHGKMAKAMLAKPGI